HVARAAALGWEGAEGPEQLRVVVEVRGVLAGVSPRAEAGTPAQRIALDAGVVGEGRQTAGTDPEAGLDRGVGLERLPVLDRLAPAAQGLVRDELRLLHVSP